MADHRDRRPIPQAGFLVNALAIMYGEFTFFSFLQISINFPHYFFCPLNARCNYRFCTRAAAVIEEVFCDSEMPGHSGRGGVRYNRCCPILSGDGRLAKWGDA